MEFTKRTNLGMANKTLKQAVLVFIFSLFLRTFLLGSFPPTLNRDEAAIGWNAFSLLKTGKDEWQQSWPLSFKSFGDYKMPLYIYLSMPAIALLGLNEFSVRLTSAFSGSLIVLLVFFLTKELFRKKTKFNLPLLTSLLVAINPWHIFYSRISFEANLCLFFTVAGVVFFLWAFKKPWLFLASALSFSLTFFSYSSAFIFTPPLIILLFLVYFQDLKKTLQAKLGAKSRWIFGLSALAFILLSFQATLGVWQVSQAKKAITLFSDPSLIDQFNHQRSQLYGQCPLWAKIWLNKPFYFFRLIARNYFLSFTPKFLFLSGGEHPWHSLPGFGNFYSFEAIFLIFGLIYLLKMKSKAKWLLLGWLFLAPLASAITVDAPHSTRSLPMLVPILIIVNLGILKISLLVKNKVKIKKKLLVMLLFLYLFCFSRWFYNYLFIYPQQLPTSLFPGFKQGLMNSQKQDENKKVISLYPADSPYIYVLFHLKIKPQIFWQTVNHYGPGVDNLEHVRSFDKFEFLYGLNEDREDAFYILRNKQNNYSLFSKQDLDTISL